MKPVLVFGGYGTFGAHVCRELVLRGVPVTVAGRDESRARAFAATLASKGLAADAANFASSRAALKGHGVAVNCSGPFNQNHSALLEACLEEGCHYADIADDRAYAALVRDYDRRFRERGLAAVFGCSSLPGISGALALLAHDGTAGTVERVRVTLFIGNNNPKGAAAVQSLLAGLGQPIAAPQGTLRGFRDREVVSLPEPFGRRGVFNFNSPDYDLLPALVGARAVSVKVGFELRLATLGFALLAVLGSGYGWRMAKLLALPGRLLSPLGCSGGAVMTELFLADGSVRRATLMGHHDGQRMAALPCALAAYSLRAESQPRHGAMTAYELLGAVPLIDGLIASGYEYHKTD